MGGWGGAEAMERLTLSDSRGEYCATCLRVLRQHVSLFYLSTETNTSADILLCNAVERAVVIEAEIAGVDNVVCPRVGSELVQRLEVSLVGLVFL